MTNSEKALGYLHLLKMEGKLNAEAIKETARLYDVSEEEVTALLKQFKNTPEYNKAIIHGIWKLLGLFLYLAFFCLLYAGMGSSVGGFTVYLVIAAICGLLSLVSLLAVIARLSEIKSAKKKEETLPEATGKVLNKTIRLKPDVIAILITTPFVAAIIISMPILYIKVSGSTRLNSNRWQLHQGVRIPWHYSRG